MESFKVWLMSLCGATAVSSLFKILLSDSTIKKSINVFFSVFILFYTVMPVQTFLKADFDFNTENKIQYDECYQEGYETIITQAITNLCNNMGVRVLSIDINSYIDDEGYFTVNKIILQTNSNNQNEIKVKIKNELGFEVEIK